MPVNPQNKGFNITWAARTRFAKVGVEVQAAIRLALQSAGKHGVEVAQSRARVDTGEMRDSIESNVEGKTITLSANVDHAPANEFGTYKMSAQPFIRPGIQAAGDKFKKEVTVGLAAASHKVIK